MAHTSPRSATGPRGTVYPLVPVASGGHRALLFAATPPAARRGGEDEAPLRRFCRPAGAVAARACLLPPCRACAPSGPFPCSTSRRCPRGRCSSPWTRPIPREARRASRPSFGRIPRRPRTEKRQVHTRHLSAPMCPECGRRGPSPPPSARIGRRVAVQRGFPHLELRLVGPVRPQLRTPSEAAVRIPAEARARGPNAEREIRPCERPPRPPMRYLPRKVSRPARGPASETGLAIPRRGFHRPPRPGRPAATARLLADGRGTGSRRGRPA